MFLCGRIDGWVDGSRAWMGGYTGLVGERTGGFGLVWVVLCVSKLMNR